jgi:hypothetical protein
MGVFVYFEKERLDTSSSTSEMLLSILAAVAQEESRNISENIKWSQRKRYSEGKPKWSAVYGYQKIGEIEYIIDEERATVVRRIFAEYILGASLPEISRGLARDSIASATGKSWSPTVLAKMLKNEKYVGDVLIQKTYTVDHITQKRVVNDQAVVPSYYVRDHHKAIIDRKTFETAQVILSLKNRHKGATQYPYFGRLACPVCGEQMVRSCIREHGHPPVWRCSGESRCRAYFIKEKYIDSAFCTAYSELDTEALERQARRRDEKISGAARAGIELKERLPQIDKVEYYLLDTLVERIVFPKWDTMVVEWTFGLKSRVRIEYLRESDIPNHKEQLRSVGSKSLSRIEDRQEKVLSPTAFERPCVFGYDSIVGAQ